MIICDTKGLTNVLFVNIKNNKVFNCIVVTVAHIQVQDVLGQHSGQHSESHQIAKF